MEIAITNGIKVTVNSQYQDFYSNPELKHFAFSYHIRIENNSESTVQLVARHWNIFDAVGIKYEVEGEGVVGKQPIIEPGDFHEYVSGCNFHAPIGRMYGYFIMKRFIDDVHFKTQIPSFIMTAPYVLN